MKQRVTVMDNKMPYNYHELKKKIFFLRSKKFFYHCIGLNKTTAPRDLSIFMKKKIHELFEIFEKFREKLISRKKN